MYCCIVGGECSLECFLDLGPGLVCICDAFIFELDEPSLGKGFSLSFGHPVEENHDLHFIGIFVHMKGKVGLHNHESSVGISSFFTEFFREGSFDFHVIVVFFVSEGIYMDGEMGRIGRGRLWGTGR